MQIRAHAFYASIDFESLIKKEMRPPYIPKLRHETDLGHFDPQQTSSGSTTFCKQIDSHATEVDTDEFSDFYYSCDN